MRHFTPTLMLLLIFAIPALASDGVLEINQTCAVQTGCFPGDTAGLPVTIASRGSYRLTSNILAAEGLNAIEVAALNVTIDLNGFSITGSKTPGEVGVLATGGAERTVVRNGFIEDFGQAGVVLGDGSVVKDCQFVGNEIGIQLSTNAGYLNNSFQDNGDHVDGGRGMGNNICGRTPCGRQTVRVQLTMNPHPGNLADSVCPNGWHFASMSELQTLLEAGLYYYDRSVGFQNNDTGFGTPLELGWVRSGVPQSTLSNCNAWTSANDFDTGTLAEFQTYSSTGFIWSEDASCTQQWRVWCVEDYEVSP